MTGLDRCARAVASALTRAIPRPQRYLCSPKTSVGMFEMIDDHFRSYRDSCNRVSQIRNHIQHGRAIYVALTGLEFVRRHLVHIYQDVFPFHLDPKHSLRNLRRGSDNDASPNVEL